MSMLDSAVEELAAKMFNKLPECTRYTKQQLNFWRDFSWSMTVGHARDWLTLHAGAYETAEGLRSFRRKSEIDYPKIRCKAAGPAADFGPTMETQPCTACGAPQPVMFAYCGMCGTKMERRTGESQ
jgi:hypothetical protein